MAKALDWTFLRPNLDLGDTEVGVLAPKNCRLGGRKKKKVGLEGSKF